MKKLSLLLAITIGLLFSPAVKAQSTANYFIGKWAITVAGTPNGDTKLTFAFERKDGKLIGTVRDSTDKEVSKITEIDEKDKTINAAFTINDHDVTLSLEPVDDDHVKGSVMGMFDAKGTRIKETDPEKK
jgi:hypothetical protein